MSNEKSTSEFDAYAENYADILRQGISVSGENRDFFAYGRIECLASSLKSLDASGTSVFDFGCGEGSSTPFFFEILGARSVLGVDVSSKSIDVACRNHKSEVDSARADFKTLGEYNPVARFTFAYCNGVFHHIPLDGRLASAGIVFNSLCDGGYFGFCENNPFNPATRFVMSRCPFDKDAIMLTPKEARRLLKEAGFEIVRTRFLFIFPRVLRFLRWLEPLLSGLPFGAQYVILCRKPID
ncbi:MAG: class I SAM-dependent DNA methyltransferase [Pyrinomonadaceae bacterium]